jgi:hypothetical protein
LSEASLSEALLSEPLVAAPEQLARAALGALLLAASLSKARVAMLEAPACESAVQWPVPDSFWIRVPTVRKQAALFARGGAAPQWPVCLTHLEPREQMAASRHGE